MAPVLDDITQGSRLSSIAAGPAVVHQVRYSPGHFMPPHAHRHANITLVLAGSQTDVIERGRYTGAPLSIIFKPSGAEHSTTIGERGLRTTVLEIDPAIERVLRRRCGLFTRCASIDSGPLCQSLIGLWAAMLLRRDSPERLVGSWLSALSPSALGLVLGSPHQARDAALIAAAEVSLTADHGPDAGTAQLAERLGLHPTSVTRLFRRHYGHGVRARIRLLRVRDAADRLAGGCEPIAAVALRTGFADQSHLTRDFRRETGLTPAQFRRLAAWPPPNGSPRAAA